MPYLVRFRVVIEEVETAVRVRAKVVGDVVGAATLRLDDAASRVYRHAGQHARPGEHGPAHGLPLRRPHRPFRTRLGPRFGGPPVHRPRRRAPRGRLDSPGVKFSFRQILASTAGAVIAAIVASSFGVKGTIIGVAIGSAAATMGTALVAQSIDRGHEAVKQVAVRVPEPSTLLRKLGGTGVSGPVGVVGGLVGTHRSGAAAIRARQRGRDDGDGIDGGAGGRDPAPGDLRRGVGPGDGAAAWPRSSPARPAVVRPAPRVGSPGGPSRSSAVTVFVLALLLITAVELISGKPLSSHLRRRRQRDDVEEPRQPVAGARHHPDRAHHDHVDHAGCGHVDHDDDHGGDSTSTTEPAAGQTTTTTLPAVRRRPPPRRRGPERGRRRRRHYVRVRSLPCGRHQCGGYQPLNSAGRLSTKLAMPSLESRVFVTSSCPSASS